MSTNRFPDAERVLVGHTSPETAYVVADYPYGFRLRCQKRYWVESTARGQRLVTQTSDPKTPGRWNKPKASTYTPLLVLYISPVTGHVESTAWTPYDGEEYLKQFKAKYTLDEFQNKTVKALEQAYARLALRRRIAGEKDEGAA